MPWYKSPDTLLPLRFRGHKTTCPPTFKTHIIIVVQDGPLRKRDDIMCIVCTDSAANTSSWCAENNYYYYYYYLLFSR